MRLDHRQGIGHALGALIAPFAAVLAVALAAGTLLARLALLARALVPGTVVALAILPRLVLPRLVLALGVAALAVVALLVLTRALFVVSPLLVALRTIVAAAFVAGAIAVVVIAASGAVLAPFAAVGVGICALLAAVALAAFVLEIDVDAGGEGIAAEDVAGRALRLDRAQQAEIVLRMLLIAFAQHPVAGGQRVARQLLVLLEHVLRGAADLDPVRAVRFERAVGIVLRLAASAAAAAAAPVAAALPLHTLEISHVIQWLWPAPKVAPQEMSYGPCRLGSGRMGPG